MANFCKFCGGPIRPDGTCTRCGRMDQSPAPAPIPDEDEATGLLTPDQMPEFYVEVNMETKVEVTADEDEATGLLTPDQMPDFYVENGGDDEATGLLRPDEMPDFYVENQPAGPRQPQRPGQPQQGVHYVDAPNGDKQKKKSGGKKPSSKKGLLIALICVGAVVLAALTVYLLDVFGVIRLPFLHKEETTPAASDSETTGAQDGTEKATEKATEQATEPTTEEAAEPTAPAVPTLTLNEAKSLWDKANRVYVQWLYAPWDYPDALDESDTLGEDAATYMRVKNYSSIAELRAYLAGYFDDTICDMVNPTDYMAYYTEQDGKLYVILGGIGGDGQHDVQFVNLTQDGSRATVDLTYSDYFTNETGLSAQLSLRYENGKWIFEDPFFFCPTDK